MEITVTLTYGEHQAIDVNLTDDQPYNPDVADDPHPLLHLADSFA